MLQPGETPDNVFTGLVKRLGMPTVRIATRQAMKIMGHQFVLGTSIDAALSRAKSLGGKGYRHSYDMLGEGAAPPPTPPAISRLCNGHRGDRQSAGSEALPAAPASPSSSRRCIRAMTPSTPSASWPNW